MASVTGPLRVTGVFGFEAVGEAEALVGALVGGGLKVLGALNFHGRVDEQADRARETFEDVGEEMIEHGNRRKRAETPGPDFRCRG